MTAIRHSNFAPLIVEEDPGVETLRVPVLKVFDGDGFLTRIESPRRDRSIEVAIRCGFIDAPEMGQPGGREARDFLASLIGGTILDLVVLTKMDTGGVFDRHGRIVAIPYLANNHGRDRSSPWGASPDGFRNIELEMVVNGWAWVLDRYQPYDQYLAALAEAQAHRRGIWASDSNMHPWEFKKERYRARRVGNAVSEQPTLFTADAGEQHCPAGCGGRLVPRTGRMGDFLGCSNFPRCRCTRSL
ncbi:MULTISPECIES: thermonuclease family protein [unclassified Sphingopyxis]|jgi:micrococcal nuclease|uniref:thermonuclease family protein n=1 Tax=unclassified Sphingopyxis TaxID=2614943 RepID=UPI0009EAA3E1|nr:thermonuclease family protein [Sphingopyxis sp. A083]